MKQILLTGSSGFVGQRYLHYNKNRYTISTISLQNSDIPSIDALKNVDTIVHLAGKAHQMEAIDPQIYFDVNYTLTKKLADAAKQAGVPHFVFISTIKVFGEHHKDILSINTPCLPENDPYGQSKLAAEQYLQSIEDATFSVAIIRPPLIYGEGVKGNLIKFLNLASKPFPLPFKNINNRRTMVFLDNFIELINCVTDKRASGVFLAGDEAPISTEKLISEMRLNMNKKSNLVAIPSFLIKIIRRVKPELELRLFGSLEVDTSETNKRLGFKPPHTTEKGIKQMVDWYSKISKN